MADPFVEVRGEFLREHIDIIDAVCQANPGLSRVGVIRELVEKWCKQKVSESTLVLRVANANGGGPESRRSRRDTRTVELPL